MSPTPTPSHSPRAVEANIEVIDDLEGEANEIYEAGNTWLTYGPPLQLARVRPPLSKTYHRSNTLSAITTRTRASLNTSSFALGVRHAGPDL